MMITVMTTYYTLRIHSKLSCLNFFSLQLFNKLDLRAYDLTVDLLDVHAVSLQYSLQIHTHKIYIQCAIPRRIATPSIVLTSLTPNTTP